MGTTRAHAGDTTVPTEKEEADSCAECGHAPLGRAAGFFLLRKRVLCATNWRDDVFNGIEYCFCEHPIHATRVVPRSERPDITPDW